jgi:hypothetical protein
MQPITATAPVAVPSATAVPGDPRDKRPTGSTPGSSAPLGQARRQALVGQGLPVAGSSVAGTGGASPFQNLSPASTGTGLSGPLAAPHLPPGALSRWWDSAVGPGGLRGETGPPPSTRAAAGVGSVPWQGARSAKSGQDPMNRETERASGPAAGVGSVPWQRAQSAKSRQDPMNRDTVWAGGAAAILN